MMVAAYFSTMKKYHCSSVGLKNDKWSHQCESMNCLPHRSNPTSKYKCATVDNINLLASLSLLLVAPSVPLHTLTELMTKTKMIATFNPHL